jgi:hypothetical protein
MAKRSKLYRKQIEAYDKQVRFPLAEAVKILKGLPQVKFDQTVDLAFKLGIDPKQSDQNVRGAIPLPKGTGKKVVVAVVADNVKAQQRPRPPEPSSSVSRRSSRRSRKAGPSSTYSSPRPPRCPRSVLSAVSSVPRDSCPTPRPAP